MSRVIPYVSVRVPGHVHWRRFDAELVLVDLKGGEYYGLSEVAAEAFEQLAGGKARRDVTEALAALYDVDRARLEEDVDALIETLIDRGLLIAGADDKT